MKNKGMFYTGLTGLVLSTAVFFTCYAESSTLMDEANEPRISHIEREVLNEEASQYGVGMGVGLLGMMLSGGMLAMSKYGKDDY